MDSHGKRGRVRGGEEEGKMERVRQRERNMARPRGGFVFDPLEWKGQ